MSSSGRAERAQGNGAADALGRVLVDSPNPYDAITDLFLGEVDGSGADIEADAVSASVDALPAPGLPAAPRAEERASWREPVRPAMRNAVPVRPLPACLDGAARGTSEPRAAALHEKMPERPKGARSRADRTTTVEAVILGHLPVLGAAWAAEYVRRIAIAEENPVAYVKFGSGRVSVELVPASALKAGEPSGAAPGRPKARNLADAVLVASGTTHRWVIRLEDDRQPSLKEIEGIDGVTVLTSGEDVAVVGAYRAIKSLCAEKLGESAPMPHLRISLMGAPPGAAKAAAEKLSGAVAAFIGRAVEVGPSVQRIEGGAPSTIIYSGELGLDIPSVLALIRMSSMRQPSPQAPVAGPTPPAGAPVPLPSAVQPRAVAGGSDTVAPGALAGHVPGLIPITARCPFAKEVEIAVDPRGNLNLLAKVVDPRNDGATIRAVIVAATWLAEHADLVGMTLPDGVSVLTGATPVSRLFVEDSKAVARLLKTGLRVHLVTRGQAEEIG